MEYLFERLEYDLPQVKKALTFHLPKYQILEFGSKYHLPDYQPELDHKYGQLWAALQLMF